MILSRRKVASYAASQLSEGADVKKLGRHLAAYLISSRQTHATQLLITDIKAALSNEHGVVSADVTSAHKLGSDQLALLKKHIAKSYDASSVTVDEHIDTAYIGGVSVKTHDAAFDFSVSNQIAALKNIGE